MATHKWEIKTELKAYINGEQVEIEEYTKAIRDYVNSLEDRIVALRARVAGLEEALKKIADGRGMIPDKSTVYMSGKVPEVPKHFNMYDMREIARRALEEK